MRNIPSQSFIVFIQYRISQKPYCSISMYEKTTDERMHEHFLNLNL